MENKHKQFTLTAEEVEDLKQLLEKDISRLNQTRIIYSNMQLWLDEYNKADKILNRIKQWQNEQKNNNND